MGQKFEFLTISSLYVPYISATAKNRGLQAAYEAFDPPCRNTEICPPWKSCLECEWRVCVSSTDALVVFMYYFTCISFAIRPSGRKSAIKLIEGTRGEGDGDADYLPDG